MTHSGFVYRSFKVVNPTPHLRPVKLKKGGGTMDDSGDNPFIYSPIVFSSQKLKDHSIIGKFIGV